MVTLVFLQRSDFRACDMFAPCLVTVFLMHCVVFVNLFGRIRGEQLDMTIS